MDADGGYQIGADTKAKYTNEKAPIALVGTLLPWLLIKMALLITVILFPCPIFPAWYQIHFCRSNRGKALQEFNPNDSVCPSVILLMKLIA
jgi:hypothetical protein